MSTPKAAGLPDESAEDLGAAILAEALWHDARKLRDGYPGSGRSIEYINGYEDAAARAELLAKGLRVGDGQEET